MWNKASVVSIEKDHKDVFTVHVLLSQDGSEPLKDEFSVRSKKDLKNQINAKLAILNASADISVGDLDLTTDDPTAKEVFFNNYAKLVNLKGVAATITVPDSDIQALLNVVNSQYKKEYFQ